MSLRARLFATYTLIVIICISLIALSVTVLLQNYRDRLAMERLDNIARPIYVQVTSLVRGQVTSRDLWTNLQEQAEKNEVYILLGSSAGNIVRQISPTPPPQQQTIKVAPGILPHGIAKATQGKFKTTDGKTFIFAAYPVSRVPSVEPAKIETLVLSVAQTGTMAIWVGLFSPFLFAGIIALGVSLIIAILFARSIYRPLNRVADAAHRIAEGEYDQKIPVAGPREVRELAVSFNYMAEQVKRSQQQLRHFVADVSHELKSPLTSIRGFAQALLDGTAGDDESKAKAAQIINDESRRMRRQVDELLELARMQSGQLKMAGEPIDIKELLEHCHELFNVQAKERDVLLMMEAEAGMSVTGDIDRLEQVFSNLLDNAIKNSPANNEVRITGSIVAGNHIEIRIIDSGPGIPPEQLPYVFERFYQVTGVRTGVGLGLAIAREIVLSHGGTIEAKSEPGEGAEFLVRLPSAPSKHEG